MKTKRRLYVQLGRLGDILNILPLCWRDYTTNGERPLLMVAEAFASILDGIGYIDPVIWHDDFKKIVPALAVAEKVATEHNAQLICTQIYGDELTSVESCSSFMRESWGRVPNAPAWGSLPLIFDRRDTVRELGVTQHLLSRSKGKPYVVVALNGNSSPFAHAHELTLYLRNQLGAEFDFVDISAFLAPRFFDVLGLLANAHCLVTVDSGALHLSPALPALPVIPFITREPSLWHGSPWRPQHIARFFYDEAPDCFNDVARAILNAKETNSRPKIWHVWSDYTPDGETARRMRLAHATWEAEWTYGNWRPCPFPESAQWRSSAELGDARPMPYVADLVDYVDAHGPKGADIIALTNADVCFTPGLTGWILDKVPRHGAAFTHRWDFQRLEKPLTNEAAVTRGKWYPGSDAFFFTVEWWEQHRHEFPAMVLGREHCDEVLRQLVKRYGGVEIRGAIYHERHPSFWEDEQQLTANPANRHNRKLARRWFLKNAYGPNDPAWWQLPVAPY